MGVATAIKKTLHDLGGGTYAYTQLPGSWGWSNAGLITDSGESLLVDTLFDLKITREMLDAMRRATPAAARINTVVNTHGNGDHCYGNALVSDAEIIGTPGCVHDLAESPASRNVLLMRAGRVIHTLGGGGRMLGKALAAVGLNKVSQLADAASLALPVFSPFDFSGIEPTPPTRTFVGELELRVGEKDVRVIELGPAHTRGDAVVWYRQTGRSSREIFCSRTPTPSSGRAPSRTGLPPCAGCSPWTSKRWCRVTGR